MPTYEYKCPKCGTEFERFQKITARAGAMCPACGGKAVRQLSGGIGLHFKGSGFYLTDYGRSGQAGLNDKAARREGSESPASDKAKPDAKPATKPDTSSGAKADAKPAKPSKKDG